MAKLNLKLVLYISLILTLSISTDAKDFDVHRKDHVSLNRIMKKRAPEPQGLGNIFGNSASNQPPNGAPAASAASSGADTQAAASSTTAKAESSSTAASASSSGASSAATTSSSGGLLGSILGPLNPSPSTTSTSSTTSSTSTTAVHTTAPPPPSQTVVNGPSGPSIYYYTSDAAPSPSSSPTTSSGTITHTAMIVLIVIGASIGGSVIIWTIIRKWKFRPSSNFEDRMQPIDWQPGNDDGGAAVRRNPSNASSFHSGTGHIEDHFAARNKGPYGTAPLNPIPDHDFTAGASALAPVGGYADLARGPSPQPMMQEALTRGPSLASTQYQYDQYGVPLHHAGYNAHGY
ncbi:hypothetical protein BJ138DRAFT_1111822 [Hygrophoropsis aurantiaca]|uniref:Uncharacterized protein n=1 Tax=Hygrophoropsis aurantiaca TaxID=72124 RepID=A0ACB8AIH8_9AGAM|nr:hypothetical protein BJ138DRAFT_1111822 [Hygrophoropsis aurantiaca]